MTKAAVSPHNHRYKFATVLVACSLDSHNSHSHQAMPRSPGFRFKKKKKNHLMKDQGLKKFHASFSLWVLTPTKPSISFSPLALPTQVKFQILKRQRSFKA